MTQEDLSPARLELVRLTQGDWKSTCTAQRGLPSQPGGRGRTDGREDESDDLHGPIRSLETVQRRDTGRSLQGRAKWSVSGSLRTSAESERRRPTSAPTPRLVMVSSRTFGLAHPNFTRLLPTTDQKTDQETFKTW